jgi:large subunit ribosomal protein L24
MKMRGLSIKKGDIVQVMRGRERGKRGKVLSVISKKMKAVVEKVNMVKRHVRPSQKYPTGGIIEKEAPLHISVLKVVCPKCDKSVRVGRKFLSDGSKVRYCKKCGEVIER